MLEHSEFCKLRVLQALACFRFQSSFELLRRGRIESAAIDLGLVQVWIFAGDGGAHGLMFGAIENRAEPVVTDELV